MEITIQTPNWAAVMLERMLGCQYAHGWRIPEYVALYGDDSGGSASVAGHDWQLTLGIPGHGSGAIVAPGAALAAALRQIGQQTLEPIRLTGGPDGVTIRWDGGTWHLPTGPLSLPAYPRFSWAHAVQGRPSIAALTRAVRIAATIAHDSVSAGTAPGCLLLQRGDHGLSVIAASRTWGAIVPVPWSPASLWHENWPEAITASAQAVQHGLQAVATPHEEDAVVDHWIGWDPASGTLAITGWHGTARISADASADPASVFAETILTHARHTPEWFVDLRRMEFQAATGMAYALHAPEAALTITDGRVAITATCPNQASGLPVARWVLEALTQQGAPSGAIRAPVSRLHALVEALQPAHVLRLSSDAAQRVLHLATADGALALVMASA